MSSDTNNLFASLTPAAVSAPDAPLLNQEVAKPDELEMLKKRAALMNIKHSPNIGLEALRAKVNAVMDSETGAEDKADETSQADAESDDKSAEVTTKSAGKTNRPQTNQEIRQEQMREQMKLVRVRITNLDPKKKDLPGEIFTVANRFIGTVRKYIPYGEVTDNGYHIPFCIFTQLEERKFLNIKTRKGKNGTPIVESQYVREFALEVLPQLTAEELATLAASQAAAGGLE